MEEQCTKELETGGEKTIWQAWLEQKRKFSDYLATREIPIWGQTASKPKDSRL